MGLKTNPHIFTIFNHDPQKHLYEAGFQLSDQLRECFLPKTELLKSLENLLDFHLVPLINRNVSLS